MYVSHMPGLLQGPVARQGKNDSSVGVETEGHCHVTCALADSSADATPGQTPATLGEGLRLAPFTTGADRFDVKHLGV
ncbi:hypothetical protein VZT92_014866 [Zoarces viviparus]|uniref:Uncharacterized protein n=1 Tax=Zoarces viviparus TaxID=48416 RepID=A0AAW1EUP3_ZOAVI